MLPQTIFYYKSIATPIGSLRVITSDKHVHAILFQGGRSNIFQHTAALEQHNDHPLLRLSEAQLQEYFAGVRNEFTLPLSPRGTVFQQKAWRELTKIPYGQTISYGEQARRIGDAKKARAIGMANGRNPIGIIIPCHRVIGASGELTGFGGGIKVKQFLLDLERRHQGSAQAYELA